jgi:TP901 family phage tail tape measure protein
VAIQLNMSIVGNANSLFTMFTGVGKELKNLEKNGASTFDKLSTVGKAAFLGTATAAIGIGAATVKMAGNFQQSMTQLQTGAGESASNMKLVSDGVLNMAVQVGASTSQLADGLYHIESAGFHGADGLNVLKVAAEGAKVGNADLDTMGKTLVGTMNSYGMAGDKANVMMNQLIATTASGDMRMQDLASSLGNVTPLAAAAGISFAQVGGAVATMTSQNMSAQQATQDLSNLIRSLQNPTDVATKAMAAMGLNSTQVAANLGKKGLTGTLDELTSAITAHMGPAGLVLQNSFNQSKSAMADANTMLKQLPSSIQGVAQQLLNGTITQKQWTASIKGMSVEQANQAKQFATVVKHATGFNDLLKAGGPAAQTYTATLAEMTGGATGLNTSLMLTGANAKVFAANVKTIGDAASKSGKDVNGWSTVQKTFNQQLAEAKGQAEALGIRIGTALMPVVQSMLHTTVGLVNWLTKHKVVAIALASVIGGVLAGAIVVYLTHLTLSAIETTKETAALIAKNGALIASKVATVASTVATNAATAAQWLFNAAMDANPVMLVVLAILALAAAAYEAYKHITGFRNFVQAAFHAVAGAAKVMWNDVLKPVWHALVDAFDWVTREAKSLWHDAIEPVFQGIGKVIQWVYDNVIKRVFALWRLELRIVLAAIRDAYDVVKAVFGAIGEVVSYVWDNILHPVFDLIGALIRFAVVLNLWLLKQAFDAVWNAISATVKWAWNNVVKPTWDALVQGIHLVGDAAMWLWHNAIEPAWRGIGTAVNAAWNNVIKPAWGDVTAGITDLENAALWLWHNVFEPVWNGIGDAVSKVWNNVLKPIFDAIKSAVDTVGGALNSVVSTGKSVIGSITGGINSLTSMFHFDDGGPVPGPKGAPQLAVVHGGEYVLSNDMLAGRASAAGAGVALSGGGPQNVVIINADNIFHDQDLTALVQTAMGQLGGRNSNTYTPYASSRNRSS